MKNTSKIKKLVKTILHNIEEDKLWIITDAERETTTICLPEEY